MANSRSELTHIDTTTATALAPIVAFLEAHRIQILHKDTSGPDAVVFTLQLPTGTHRTLTVSYKFLELYTADEIRGYLANPENDFPRRLNNDADQHITH